MLSAKETKDDNKDALSDLEGLSAPSLFGFQDQYRGFGGLDSQGAFGSLGSLTQQPLFHGDSFDHQYSGGAFTLHNEVYRSIDVSAVAESASTGPGFDGFGAGGFGGLDKMSLTAGSALSLNAKQSRAPLDVGFEVVGADVSAPRTKAAADVLERLEPPTVPGNYLEPSYHFHSVSSPGVVLQSMLSILQGCQVDCSLKRDKFKIKALAYRSGSRVQFSARLFSVGDSSGKRYAVEFQRRSGDVIFFNELYRTVKRALASKSLFEKQSKSQCSQSSLQSLPMPGPLPDFPSSLPLEVQATPEQNKEAVKCLVEMAASKCVDVKAQALTALVELSVPSAKAQDALISSGGLDTFLEELSSKFEDVHRCAVSGLANLTRDREDVCQRVRDAGAVTTLLALARSSTAHIVRESARALANIGSALGSKVLDENFKTTLCNLRCSPDPRARENVAQLLDNLHL